MEHYAAPLKHCCAHGDDMFFNFVKGINMGKTFSVNATSS